MAIGPSFSPARVQPFAFGELASPSAKRSARPKVHRSAGHAQTVPERAEASMSADRGPPIRGPSSRSRRSLGQFAEPTEANGERTLIDMLDFISKCIYTIMKRVALRFLGLLRFAMSSVLCIINVGIFRW